VVAIASLVMGSEGWEISRIWLYLLGSAMMTLIGFQFIIYWVLMRVLEDLSQREILIKQDLQTHVVNIK
jgi:hypothetical protein